MAKDSLFIRLAAVFLVAAPVTLLAEAPPTVTDPKERADECRASISDRSLRLPAIRCVRACDSGNASHTAIYCDSGYEKFRQSAYPDPEDQTTSNATPVPGIGRATRSRASASSGPVTVISVPDTIGYVKSRRGFHHLHNDDQEHRRLCGLRFAMKTEAAQAALRELKEMTRVRLTDIEVTVDTAGRRTGICKAGAFEVVGRN